MNKSDWYKIGAIALVLAFVFEGVAIGMLQNNGSNGDNGQQQPTGEEISGNAVANFTVLRYEPYIIVSGNGTAIDGVKKKLIDSGVATYAVPNEGNLVVSLASSKSVVSSAEEFESANATVLATAVISSQSKVVVQGDGITTTVEGTSFRFQMRPIFEEGSQFPASFSAIAQGGQLVSMGNFNILPAYVQGAIVQAELISGSAGQIFVEVLWSNRTAAKSVVKESGAAYRERSFIIVPANATQTQLAALQQAGKEYVTAIQQGVISVRNDFTDVNRSITDLQNAGIPATFPTSIALFENATAEENAVALVGKLKEAGIEAKITRSKTVRAALPDFIEKDGKRYSAKDGVVEFELASEAVNGTVFLAIDFEAQGSAVARILNVGQVAAQIAEDVAPDASGANGNETAVANATANAT